MLPFCVTPHYGYSTLRLIKSNLDAITQQMPVNKTNIQSGANFTPVKISDAPKIKVNILNKKFIVSILYTPLYSISTLPQCLLLHFHVVLCLSTFVAVMLHWHIGQRILSPH